MFLQLLESPSKSGRFISSHAGGKHGDYVSDLVIDAWTAEVLETEIVSGLREPPEGDYPTRAAASSAQPSPGPSLAAVAAPGSSLGIAGLWGSFAPEDLTVAYTCEPPLTFTAAGLAAAPGPDELSPPIDIGSIVDPDDAIGLTDWRIVTDDGERAFAVAGRDDRAVASSIPLHYLRLARADAGWRSEGSGDCAPQARFPETSAIGGFWRLNEARPRPRPDARAIHVKVWGDRDRRTSVELRGEPVVVMTDDTVLLTIPVANVPSGDMCTPSPPERITVRAARATRRARAVRRRGPTAAPGRPVAVASGPDKVDERRGAFGTSRRIT